VEKPDTKDPVLAEIASCRWDLGISFYSDLILPPTALAAISLPLNIHPALPRIRGVGHDLIPLIEEHASVGTTLHRMERRVDSGEILIVNEVPFPPGHNYASLRKLNQSLSLAMLDRVSALLGEAHGMPQLETLLRAHAAKVRHSWGAYYSRRMIAALTMDPSLGYSGRLALNAAVSVPSSR
jgi:methionyl-tRNA formyltransferase